MLSRAALSRGDGGIGSCQTTEVFCFCFAYVSSKQPLRTFDVVCKRDGHRDTVFQIPQFTFVLHRSVWSLKHLMVRSETTQSRYWTSVRPWGDRTTDRTSFEAEKTPRNTLNGHFVFLCFWLGIAIAFRVFGLLVVFSVSRISLKVSPDFSCTQCTSHFARVRQEIRSITVVYEVIQANTRGERPTYKAVLKPLLKDPPIWKVKRGLKGPSGGGLKGSPIWQGVLLKAHLEGVSKTHLDGGLKGLPTKRPQRPI